MENSNDETFNATIGNTVLCDGFLIPMTDFVNNVGNMENYPSHEKALSWIYNYATFLKQHLKLEMFVPCDEDGNVLEIVPYYAYSVEKVNEYKKAKERCLFKGFKMYKGNPYNYNKARAFTQDYIDEKWIIEKIIHWDLELTESAIKQSGL